MKKLSCFLEDLSTQLFNKEWCNFKFCEFSTGLIKVMLLFVIFKTPVLKTQEKMVGCWFFTSGPVSLSAKIERKGYCNGKQNVWKSKWKSHACY